MKNHQAKLLAVISFLLFIVLRLWFLFQTDEAYCFGYDEPGRIGQAFYWYLHPNHIPGELVWLPLHHILLTTFFPLFADKFLAARLVTLLFSIGGAILLFSWTKRISGIIAAAVAVLILAVIPLHLEYSIRAMSEIPFLFFLLLALLSTTELIRGRSSYWFFPLILSLWGTNLIRYEGWVWTAIISLILLTQYQNKWKVILAGLPTVVPILAYVFFSLLFYAAPFWGLNDNLRVVDAANSTGTSTTSAIQFLETNTLLWWPALLLLLGLTVAELMRTKYKPIFVGVLFFIILQLVLALAGKVMFHWRFFMLDLVLLLPLAASSIISIKQLKWKALIVILIFMPGAYQTINIGYSWTKPNTALGFHESAKTIASKDLDGLKVLNDVDQVCQGNWGIWAGLPYGKGYPVVLENESPISENWLWEQYDTTILKRQVQSNCYKYFAFKKGDYLHQVITSKWGRKRIASYGAEFKPVFNQKNYGIVEVVYQDTSEIRFVKKYLHLYDHQPLDSNIVFREFSEPEAIAEAPWLNLFALGFLTINGPFNGMDEETTALLFDYLEKEYPNFHFPKDAVGDEGLLNALRTWSNNYPEEGKKAVAKYRLAYEKWKTKE